MQLTWRKSQAGQSPALLDTTSSKKVVYIRKNVEEVEKKDEETGETYTVYQYDECRISKTDYIHTLHDRPEETDEALQEMILAVFGGED